MSSPMKRSLSSSPCLWQNFLHSQWERDYPANIPVINRASLKSIFWHWWGSFITMDCCKLHWGVSSSLPSSSSASSSNRAADGHTRDRAGKQWEMLFHWQLVPRWVCICFCLLPMKYYGSECAIRVGTVGCEIKKHTAGIARPLEEFAFSVPVKWDTGPVVQQDGSVPPGSFPWQEFCWNCWKLQFDWGKLMSLPFCCSPAAGLWSCWISLCFPPESNSFRHLPLHQPGCFRAGETIIPSSDGKVQG